MSVKQKINISEKMYDILVIWLIFVEIFHDFGLFFATRIRLTKMKQIQRIRIRNTDQNHKNHIFRAAALYYNPVFSFFAF